MNQLEIGGLVWEVVLVGDPLALVPSLQLSGLASVHMSLHSGGGDGGESGCDVSVRRRSAQRGLRTNGGNATTAGISLCKERLRGRAEADAVACLLARHRVCNV